MKLQIQFAWPSNVLLNGIPSLVTKLRKLLLWLTLTIDIVDYVNRIGNRSCEQ